MRHIELTQGFQTVVDDDLYDWLSQWKWYYRKRTGSRQGGDVVRTLHGYDKEGHVKSQTLYMASLICPVPAGFVIDHKDRNPLNNQRSNLRRATYRNNSNNSVARTNNKVGVRCVHWSEAKQRFIVQVSVDGKRKWVGAFRTVEEAAEVAAKAQKKYYGKFAQT